STIFLLAPTTPDARIAQVARLARGYVYYVSLKGVTGASHLDLAEVAGKVDHIPGFVRPPLGGGFGIRDGATARAIAAPADAVVIGSALVQVIERATPDTAPRAVEEWVAGIRRALDEPRTRAA